MVDEALMFRLSGNVLTAPRVCGLLTIPDLLRQVQTWCLTGGPALVVDLSPVRDTEMAVFRALLWSRRHCRLRGRDLEVVGTAAGVLPPRADALVRDLLRCHPDLASAEAAVEERLASIPA